jgi:hypothetical protein
VLASPSPALVEFHRLTYPVPDGWHLLEETPQEWPPPDRTVAVGDSALERKPVHGQLPQTVRMRALYGEDQTGLYSPPGPGARYEVRNGQPTWLTINGLNNGWMVQLTLPWLNAVVVTTAPDEHTARSLVERIVIPQPQPTWPAISFASQLDLVDWTGEGEQGTRTVRDQEQIRRILTQLSDLPPVTEPTAECTQPTWAKTYVLTVKAANGGPDQPFLIRHDACRQINGPTGRAATLTDELWRDVQDAFEVGD